MSSARPENKDEWLAYISTLDADELWSKSIAANSQKFVDILLGDGLSMTDIMTVFAAFARRFADLGIRPPSAGVVSLSGLMESGEADHVTLPRGVTLEEEPDDVEAALAKMDLESDW